MSAFSRKIIVIVAIMLFVVLAPLLILRTSGYEWGGWRHPLVLTGLIAVNAPIRASVLLNGTVVGTTPVRLRRLVPGNYTVTLVASGYQSWDTNIHLDSGQVAVVNPIAIFPEHFSSSPMTIEGAWDEYFTDQHHGIYGVRHEKNEWTVRLVWPTLGTPLHLDAQPTAIVSSITRQMTGVFTSAGLTYFVPGNAPWTVSRFDQPVWSSSSEFIVFGVRNGNIIQDDAVSRQETTLGSGTSVTYAAGSLWSTANTDGSTRVAKRDPFGSATFQTITTIPGRWTFIGNEANVLLVQNTSTKDTYRIYPTDGARLYFGKIDTLFWSDAALPPLWQDGSDTLTLDANGAFLLLDRGAATYQWLSWIDPRNLMLTFAHDSLAIRGVSDQQGRKVFLQDQLPSGSRVVANFSDKKTVVVIVPMGEHRVIEYHW